MPRIMTRCGHSLCQLCLKRLIRRCYFTTEINCPTCRESHETKAPNIENSIKLFPQNYAIKYFLESNPTIIKEEHENGRCPCTRICYDENCQTIKYCCEACMKSRHPNCDETKIVLKEKIGKEIAVLEYKHCYDEFEETIELCNKKFETEVKMILKIMAHHFMEKLFEFKIKEEAFSPHKRDFEPDSLKLFKRENKELYFKPYNYDEISDLHSTLWDFKERLDEMSERLREICDTYLEECFEPVIEASDQLIARDACNVNDSVPAKINGKDVGQSEALNHEPSESLTLAKRSFPE